MTQFKLIAFIVLALAGLLSAGCDVGVNPLLFDGSPLIASFSVNVTSGSASFNETKSVNPQEALEAIDDAVDSIKVFNITLLADSVTGGAASAATFYGAAYVDNVLLFEIPANQALSLSSFTTERSIFDSTLTGVYIFNQAGVDHLLDILSDRDNLPTQMLIRGTGTATSTAAIQFKVKVKVYTQVFTEPPNGD